MTRSLWPTNPYLQHRCTSYLGGSVRNKKQWLGLGLVAVAAVGLAACGNRSSRNAASSSSEMKTKAAMVTDTGGVDDKSFNQ